MELQTMKVWSLRIAVLFYLTFSVAASSEMFLEPGVFEVDISLSPTATDSETIDAFEYFMMQKSMYANSEIGVEVLNCSSDPKDCKFTLEWTVRQSDCDGVYRSIFADSNTTASSKSMEQIYKDPNCFILLEENSISYVKSIEVKPNPEISCAQDSEATHDKLNDLKGNNWECSKRDKTSTVCNKKPFCGPIVEEKKTSDTKSDDDGSKDEKNKDDAAADTKPADPNSDKRRKRAAEDSPAADPPAADTPAGEEKADPPAADSPAGEEKADPPAADTPAGEEKGDPPAADIEKGGDAENGDKAEAGDKDQEAEVKSKAVVATNDTLLKYRVVHTNVKDGRFIFIVYVTSQSAKQMNISMRIRMKSSHGYLSATQYPLLPFYGVMCAMYSILGLIWMILLFRQWRDLLRIQFWISVVIILGLIEKAAFVAEFERHNNSGSNSSAGIFFAEELSVLKRTMARMLVIVVSLGYGITRPRLGRDLNWLLGAGVMFFLLSSIESYFRIFEPNKSNDLIALLPISVLDAVLCWWIFRSLVDTSRTLRLRRNLVKLWLYRHFTNALIFCVVAAVVFLVWSLKAHRMTKCVKNWNEIWVDDAYWHILFCVILIVIMILFRPTANNQRYAYSVLSDAVDDDESKEPMMNDAFENVKMRNVHSNKSSNQPKEVDDLQWVEDNIPAAVADAALGAFDDSEEELITNVERNKME
ncbi:transmembrane protein 87A-like isoform X3 [Lytechinus variegatus]|uniref:transmembrane protein 87A-like isoform X3 n=1 Tax=Lytechinus variegatus TaxID=7654 RepID=UPI001BB19E3C|nr:transmembrane protein 87A-like isoform X3 [Lytechinus variegatus]